MKEIFIRIVQDEELRAKRFILNQIADRNSEQYGGFVEPEMHWVQPKLTIYHLTTLLALYNTPQSCYYHDPRAIERVNTALDYIARYQHDDGTFDYLDVNFHSAPDTAFCVKRLLPSYHWLEKHQEKAEDHAAFGKIESIIHRAADGIAAGGFHTPNHRWAIASVLMACANIFGEEKYRARAQQYLNEGIDCNEYGEYSERSSGNYNRINDDAMLLLYEETGDEIYLDYAQRNLKMMFSYFEPDGSIFTKNSTRYDSWMKFYPDNYYFDYLYVSYLRKEPEFAAAANQIMDDVLRRGEKAPDCLHLLMSHPALMDYEPEGCGFPQTYRLVNSDAGIVRVRKNTFSYTVLSKNPNFLYFQVGALTVSVRLGIIYFDKRSFQPEGITDEPDGGYRLEENLKGWFYLPLREKPESSDWWKMDNASRELAPGPDLKLSVAVNEEEGGVALHLRTDGCGHVPFKIEFGTQSGCFVKSDGFLCEAAKGGRMVVRSGSVELTKGLDCIDIGPAFGSHFYIGGKDGSQDAGDELFYLYFTGFTNTDHVIHIGMKNERFAGQSDL
jgi:hypothetical protein